MTNKEKMLAVLEDSYDFEDFVYKYLDAYHKEFSAGRLLTLTNTVNLHYVAPMILNLERAVDISEERALYLKTYLEGKMYTTKEAAIKHIPVQIKNAEAILDACKNVTEED